MTSSFKQKRQSGVARKSKHAHNATKVMKSGTDKRGIKTRTLYWDQRSGSWKSTKNPPMNVGLKKDYTKTQYGSKKNYELSKKNVNKSSEQKLKEIKDKKYTSTGKLKIKGKGAHRTWDTTPGNKAEGSSTTFKKKGENNKTSDGKVTQKQLDTKVQELKLKNKYKQLSEEDKNKAVENFKKNYKVKDTETGFNVKKKKDAPNPEYYKKKDSPKDSLKVKPKKMHAIEKRNRERFGDAHVDKLKARYAEFKAKRKKKKKS